MDISSHAVEQKMNDVTMTDVKDYLSTPERPVTLPEFRAFWEVCSVEEKAQIRRTVA